MTSEHLLSANLTTREHVFVLLNAKNESREINSVYSSQPLDKSFMSKSTRRALTLFNHVPLSTRRALHVSLYKVYANSVLLVLNRTLLHGINALLVLS